MVISVAFLEMKIPLLPSEQDISGMTFDDKA